MSEENKQEVLQPKPGEGVSPTQDSPTTTPAETTQSAGIPQSRFDEIYKKWKTESETNQYLQQEVATLRSTIDEFVKKPVASEANVPLKQKKDMTNEEWNIWFQENPAEAIDWRGNKIAEKERERAAKQSIDVSFQVAQAKSREKIVATHADMYLKNADGTVKRDSSNLPILDMASEKVRIFNDIVRQNPGLARVESGPELAMIQMEKILEQKNIDPAKIKQEGIEEGIRVAQAATKNAQNAFTAGSSANVPENKVNTNLSDIEKKIADRMHISYADYASQKGVKRSGPKVKVDYS